MTNFSRYNRQLQLPRFGEAAQQQLQKACVLVVGAGGLGVPALQYLTGMGIGHIGIMDGDTISLTNLHRQVLYAEAEAGKLKAVIAKEKLGLLNSSVQVEAYTEMLNVNNALAIIAKYDVVIDASDNFAARYLINDACVILNKPFVYGAIQQWEGHLSVFNYKDGPTYRCLYAIPPATGEIPDCNTAGVLGVVPGIIGCWQALEAIKIITGMGKTLSGYIKIFNFLDGDEYQIKLKTNPGNRRIQSLQETYETACATSVQPIQPEALYAWYLQHKDFVLLDVREPEEYNNGHLQNARLLPVKELAHQAGEWPIGIPVVTFCERGSRSNGAAALLKEKNSTLEVYSLAGGMEAWTARFGDMLVEV